MAATVKGEDVSTMERVYRWVAGYYMVKDKPIKGFGPGTFYENYRSYTVNSFTTYISNNIEKSGIHCYYLMILAEQGFIGFFIFISLCFYALIRAEKIYHKQGDPFLKDLCMTGMLSMIIILSILLINDMLETHKIGPFFLLILAIFVNLDLGKIQGKIQSAY